MSSVNKVILVGNLGADPEIRYTQSGQPVCSLRIATSKWNDRDGNRQERTEWHSVTVWESRLKSAANILPRAVRSIWKDVFRVVNTQIERVLIAVPGVVANNVVFLSGQ